MATAQLRIEVLAGGMFKTSLLRKALRAWQARASLAARCKHLLRGGLKRRAFKRWALLHAWPVSSASVSTTARNVLTTADPVSPYLPRRRAAALHLCEERGSAHGKARAARCFEALRANSAAAQAATTPALEVYDARALVAAEWRRRAARYPSLELLRAAPDSPRRGGGASVWYPPARLLLSRSASHCSPAHSFHPRNTQAAARGALLAPATETTARRRRRARVRARRLALAMEQRSLPGRRACGVLRFSRGLARGPEPTRADPPGHSLLHSGIAGPANL